MKKNLSKTFALPFAAVALSAIGTANADVVLGGPGLPIGTYNATDSVQYVEVDLGEYYKYEVHGFYGRYNASTPIDSWVDSDGKFYTNNGNAPTNALMRGGVRIIADSQQTEIGSSTLLLDAANIQQTTGDTTIEHSPVAEFENVNVKLGFWVDTNVTDPSGYIVVKGVGIKSPPKPSGELTVPLFAVAMTNPNIGWSIKRESDLDDMEGYHSTMDLDLTGDLIEPTDPTDTPEDTNDGWKNGTKTNNGHGNNADGVDVSNPGKGKGGPNGTPDTDYNNDGVYEDDELKTGW